ncbi:hypothetical protein EDC96DRAFT_548363 [Choanephora cucurbitarum]|nr:hypothetical protein EDC96DRAFT_548363 [Choanephora cucurbitarum]
MNLNVLFRNKLLICRRSIRLSELAKKNRYLTDDLRGHQEAPISIDWGELNAAFLALPTFPYLHYMRILIAIGNIMSMAKHEQNRLSQINTTHEASNRPMKMAPKDRDYDSINICTRSSRHNRGLRVETTLSEEQLGASMTCLQSTSTILQTKRRRSFRRPEHHTTKKIRVLILKLGLYGNIRIYNSLESMQVPVPQPSMQSDDALSTQDY